MVELRAILQPTPEPLRIHRGRGALAETSFRPLARGLVFLAALSLPVLGSTFADRFHGGAPGAMQVAAVPLGPPLSGAAANRPEAVQAAAITDRQAMLIQGKFAQSLRLQ